MKKYLFYVVILFFSKTLFAQKNEVFLNISQTGVGKNNVFKSLYKQNYINFGLGYNYIKKNNLYYGIGLGFYSYKHSQNSNTVIDTIANEYKNYSSVSEKFLDLHLGKINRWKNFLFHSQTGLNFGISTKSISGNEYYLNKGGINTIWTETIYTNPKVYSFQAYFSQSIYYRIFSKLYAGLEVKPAITYTYSKGKSSVEQIDYIKDINKITENDFKFNHLAFDVYPFIFGLRYQF